MQEGVPRRRRARPVADAPVDELLARSDEMAKGWLLALVEELPLERSPAIPAADLARDGPPVCDAIVRALADDADLRRLQPGGALERIVARAGELAGAGGAEHTAHAVDVLHSVIWSAVRDELRRPDPDQLIELAERLNLVMELVRAASLRRGGEDRDAGAEAGDGFGADAGNGAVDRQDPPGTLRPVEPVVPRAEPAVRRVEPAESAESAESVAAAAERGALWLGALASEIARARSSGAPLSLLLAELDETDRMLSVEPVAVASATFGRFAQAVRSVVRRQDILACESESRAWIIARDTSRAAAQALGSRVSRAVREAEAWRGAPMTVSVGLAVLGEDGDDAGRLMEVAEEAALAAAASGIGIIRAVPPAHESDDDCPPVA
jgi:GGDEF domain-containing protein